MSTLGVSLQRSNRARTRTESNNGQIGKAGAHPRMFLAVRVVDPSRYRRYESYGHSSYCCCRPLVYEGRGNSIVSVIIHNAIHLVVVVVVVVVVAIVAKNNKIGKKRNRNLVHDLVRNHKEWT